MLTFSEKYGFYTYVQKRLHNMRQSVNPGEMYEELLIANYDLEAQAKENKKTLMDETRQISLFDLKYDY